MSDNLTTGVVSIVIAIIGLASLSVILSKNYHASDELAKELQEHVKKVTAPYKYPRIVEFVTELPKTISGKIRRVQIREDDNKE